MEPEEQDRGLKACTTYVARLCRCAEQQPTLAEQCRLAQQQPDALRTTLDLVNGKEGRLALRELSATLANARRTIQSCFEADAALDPATCPR